MKSAILSDCARASIESRTADRAAGGDTEAGETIRRRRLSRKKTAHRRVVRFIRDPIGTRLKIIPRANVTRSSHVVVVARFGSVASLAMNPEYDYLFKLLVRLDALVAMRARIRERERGFGVRVVR